MTLQIEKGTVPQDEPPFIGPSQDEAPPISGQEATGWYDPEFPFSTEEHKLGFFPDKDGNPDFDRPRKRRPRGSSGGLGLPSVATSARANTIAQTAATMLARMNNLVGMSLMMFGLPLSGQAIKDAEEVFKEMAFEALQTDPALARKILSAGASSGQAQLTMAYVMLGAQVAPTAVAEFKERRQAKETDDDE